MEDFCIFLILVVIVFLVIFQQNNPARYKHHQARGIRLRVRRNIKLAQKAVKSASEIHRQQQDNRFNRQKGPRCNKGKNATIVRLGNKLCLDWGVRGDDGQLSGGSLATIILPGLFAYSLVKQFFRGLLP